MGALILMAWVPGEPATKGSLKAILPPGRKRPILVEDNVHSKPWRRLVAQVAAAHLPAGFVACDGPVEIVHHFIIAPHASSTWSVPAGHHDGDLDKLQRCVWDALTDAQVWTDDSRVCKSTATKRFGNAPGVWLAVSRMDA